MFTHRHRRVPIRGTPQQGWISLSEMKEEQSGIIVKIAGGAHAAKRLADLGLSPGAEVEVLSSTFFSGPIQIYVCGSKLIIGHGLATKIIVEPR